MEPTLYPLDYPALAREALDGGFTQALDGFRPTRGFVVSTRPDAERTIELTANGDAQDRATIIGALYSFVVHHGHALRHGYLIGAWRDGDRVVLDLVQVFERRSEAMIAGRRAKQDAIYDLGTGETVRLAVGRVERLADGRAVARMRERMLDDGGWPELDDGRWDDDPNPYHGNYSEL